MMFDYYLQLLGVDLLTTDIKMLESLEEKFLLEESIYFDELRRGC
jgi:hypothetical protein